MIEGRKMHRGQVGAAKLGSVAMALALVAGLGAAAFFFLGGSLDGPGKHVVVVLDDADGLEVGQAVVLNGVRIGSVREVRFATDSSNRVHAVVGITAAHLRRLDPGSLFIVRPTDLVGMSHLMLVSNACAPTPAGLGDGAQIEGYSGNIVVVVGEILLDKASCRDVGMTKLQEALGDAFAAAVGAFQ